MGLIPFQLAKLDKLDLKTPPAELFEELLGYAGDRRWVGFYYEGGCLYHTAGDGVDAGHWQPWLIWHWTLGHEIIEKFCFGYDDRAARDMLVLDRKSRTLYGGQIPVAREVVRQQLPSSERSESLDLSVEHLEQLKERSKLRLLEMEPEEYRARRERFDRGLEELQMWLREHGGGDD